MFPNNQPPLSNAVTKAEGFWQEAQAAHLRLQQYTPEVQRIEAAYQQTPMVGLGAIAYLLTVLVEMLFLAPAALTHLSDLLPFNSENSPVLFGLVQVLVALALAALFVVPLGFATAYFQRNLPFRQFKIDAEIVLDPVVFPKQKKAIKWQAILSFLFALLFLIGLSANRAFVLNNQAWDGGAVALSIALSLLIFVGAWMLHPLLELFQARTAIGRKTRRTRKQLQKLVDLFKAQAKYILANNNEHSLFGQAEATDQEGLLALKARLNNLLADELKYTGLIPKRQQAFQIFRNGSPAAGLSIALITKEGEILSNLTDAAGYCHFKFRSGYDTLAEVFIAGRSESNFKISEALFSYDFGLTVQSKNDEREKYISAS